MMPIEKAINRGMLSCQRLASIIEANEADWKCMDGTRRNEMGAWRCLMHAAGVPKDLLPEMPFLDPAHLEAFKERQARRKAAKDIAA